MVTTWLSVQPLDTVMVRDGRAFTAGQASRGEAVTPPPSTLGGVVYQAIGRNVKHRIVGPVVDVAGAARFPAPADVVRDEEGRVIRLRVAQRPDGVSSDLDARAWLSHVLDGEGSLAGDWVSGDGLAAWLSGDWGPGAQVTGKHRDRWMCPPPWVVEPRVGLAREWFGPHRDTAFDGMLYSADHQRVLDGMRFLVGCEDDVALDVSAEVVGIGGRGRLAHVSAHPHGSPFPAAPRRFPQGRVSLYLATPALLEDVLWHPPGARLCALALTGPVPIASASWRRGLGKTRLLRWAVPAGTVYYLEFDTEDAALAWSRDWHGRLLPPGAQGEDGQEGQTRIATAGFGTCLTGSW